MIIANLAINGGEAIAAELKSKIPNWPQANEADKQRITEILEGEQWFRNYSGSWAEQFEQAWAEYCNAQHCIATANGTVSLQLALRSKAR